MLKIGLRIGEWAGVDPGSLQFCFDALVAGTNPVPSLDIDFLPRQNRCRTCGTVFAVKDYQIDCPECGEPLVMQGGCQNCASCGYSICTV